MLAAHILMCRSHWKKVPHATRSKVWAAWEQWRHGTLTAAELRAVQDRATAAVEAATGEKVKGGAA